VVLARLRNLSGAAKSDDDVFMPHFPQNANEDASREYEGPTTNRFASTSAPASFRGAAKDFPYGRPGRITGSIGSATMLRQGNTLSGPVSGWWNFFRPGRILLPFRFIPPVIRTMNA